MERQNDREHRKVRYRTPPVEIYETGDIVRLRAEMPGVAKEDFDVGIDKNELTIRGKRKPLNSGLKLMHGESDRADYFRVFSIGDELDASNVEAKVENGILTLTLKKKSEVLPKKVTVEVG